jgi:hypothetical protein
LICGDVETLINGFDSDQVVAVIIKESKRIQKRQLISQLCPSSTYLNVRPFFG